MDDLHQIPAGDRSPHGRVPSPDQAEALRARVAAVLRVLHEAGTHVQGGRALDRSRLPDVYGGRLEEAMLALGETLAGFLWAGDQPADLLSLRADFLEPILSLSRSLAVYSRAEEWSRNKEKTGELDPVMLEGRAVGFDAETLLLDNFYKNTVFARSLRARASTIMQLSLEAMQRPNRTFVGNPRALVIGANSILQVRSPSMGSAVLGQGYALIVDGDTQALRLARQRYAESFGIEPDVLRAKPESLIKNWRRIGGSFDVVYTLMQYDMCPPQAALALTRSLSEMMKPGAALITGCFLPSIPHSYRALALAFTDLQWQYWDEAMWREMLGQLPFDLSASHFEVASPATLVVLARKSASAASA